MTNRKDKAPNLTAEGASNPSTAQKADQTDMNTENEIDEDVPALDGRIQGLIGQKLRTHYDTLVNDKIPDNLLKLLEDLAKSELDSKKES
jgi:Anti-sigma factor NepR